MRLWAEGLLRRAGGRTLAAAAGVGVAVALVASLGLFLTGSRATMTARALRSVAVDWQVQVQRGADPGAVVRELQGTAGVRSALPVGFVATTGFEAAVGGSVQTTGPGVLLGLPNGYRQAFPGQLRQLTGRADGVLLAQQTAANLHVAPGDQVTVGLGRSRQRVAVSGVVDLPQADALFQRIGAPAQSQPVAPPDNVVLVPAALFTQLTSAARVGPRTVTWQIHVSRDAPLPPDPVAAFVTVTAEARHLEVQLAGAVRVGDNQGSALDAARSDALYAQVLFLFLGVPGVVLAALLVVAVCAAGAERRRREQALLRIRGVSRLPILALAGIETLVVSVLGGLLGVAGALLGGKAALGPVGASLPVGAVALWCGVALAVGLAVAALAALVPTARDLRHATVQQSRLRVGRLTDPWWMLVGADFALLTAAVLVFRASSSNNYSLVLAPEGVATISVSYWAFLGPALLWLGGAMFLWRLAVMLLRYGRRPLTASLRPLTGRLASTAAATMSRQRRPVARSVVLLALAVSFAVSTAVFNDTYRQQAEADAELTNGADVTVTESPGAAVPPSAAARIEQVPGVRHVEPLQHRFAYVGADLQDLYGVDPRTITRATSLQDAYFVGGTAHSLMARLAAAPDSVLVSDETVHDFQLTPGDLLRLRLQDAASGRYKTISFHYAGIVKEFPTAPSDSFLVANADYVSRATGSDSVGALLIDTGGSGQRSVARDLRQRLGTAAQVTDVTQSRARVGSSLTSVDLSGLTRLELSFAVLLAAGAGGLVLALGIHERRRTVAVAAVLGATRGQVRGLLLSEAGLVSALGVLGGAVLAWTLSQMLVRVLTGVFDPPPSSTAVPWAYLGATFSVTVVAIALAAGLGARFHGRPAVEELREL